MNLYKSQVSSRRLHAKRKDFKLIFISGTPKKAQLSRLLRVETQRKIFYQQPKCSELNTPAQSSGALEGYMRKKLPTNMTLVKRSSVSIARKTIGKVSDRNQKNSIWQLLPQHWQTKGFFADLLPGTKDSINGKCKNSIFKICLQNRSIEKLCDRN